MKKAISILLLLTFTLQVFSQKKELKEANKAVEAGQFSAAITALSHAKPLLDGAKDKYKAQYYFLLGKAYYANGTHPENTAKVVEAFNHLFDIEKSSGERYSKQAASILNQMKMKLYDAANKEFTDAYDYLKSDPEKGKSMYLNSSEKYLQIYDISKGADTIALYQAARAEYFGKNFEKSIKHSQQLIDLGFTGKGTQYYATSAVNGKKVYFNSKSEMDNQVKLKIVTDPQVKKYDSQVPDIYNLMAKSYMELKQYDRALEAIQKARQLKPDSYNYVIDEANIYFFKGDKNKFKEKLEEAIKINPDNAVLHFNIGVMKAEQGDLEGALKSYEKAVEIDPNYVDAYNNMGAAVLEQAKPIVEEMNNTNDFDKYDQLQAKQLEIYRRALPYYEKAYQLAPDRISIVQTLLGIYENLEMDAKSKELRAVYKKLKAQQ